MEEINDEIMEESRNCDIISTISEKFKKSVEKYEWVYKN